MKKTAYITLVLFFTACTKDMTEIIDASQIDGSNSTIEVFSSNDYIDDWGVGNIQEFENGRLMVSYFSGNSGDYYYINLLNEDVEQYFFTNSMKIPATKDYFLHKWSNNAKLMDKNNQEVMNFEYGSAIFQANPDWFTGQYESNTFMGYTSSNNYDVVSLTNAQVVNNNADITYSDYATGLGFPISNYMYLNKDFLFFVNVENITSNNTYRLSLNKYSHSLQFLQSTPLNTAESYQNAITWLNNHEGNPYRVFPNNYYDKLIISSGSPDNWNILDDDFQVIGNFNYTIDLNNNDVTYGRHYISKRGEIISWNSVNITIYDINSGLQNIYNIRTKFQIPAEIPQNEVYILWVAERKAGGFYVLYQYPEAGGFKAYLRVIKE